MADDLIPLLTELVSIDSTNPSLVDGGPGEKAVADVVARELMAAGFEVEIIEVLPGRPNVIGRLKGSGGGRSLLLCSHTDVVGASAGAFTPKIEAGRMHGRGTIDMKAGLAASLVAAGRIAADVAAGHSLSGDLIVAGVIDEEWTSAGAVAMVEDLHADGAILPEQTGLDIVTEHGGFAWFEITSVGAEAAGDDPVNGIDAISLMGRALTGLADLDAEIAARPQPAYGRACLHASTIKGGSQLSAYPADAIVGVERCMIPGETWEQAESEIREILDRAKAADPRFNAELSTIVGRNPVSLDPDEPVIAALTKAAASMLGHEPVIRGDMGWLDSGVLVEAGIPCAVFGPTGAGEHTESEWVDLESVATCADVLESCSRGFCA